MKNTLLIALYFLLVSQLSGQGNPIHVSTSDIYDFLDEMALNKVISLNTAIQPYADQYIFSCLQQIKLKEDALDLRQQKALDRFYQYYALTSSPVKPDKDSGLWKRTFRTYKPSLNPPGIFYQDSAFQLAVEPIWGMDLMQVGEKTTYHVWGGASLRAHFGKNLSAYASLRDNTDKDYLARKSYLNLRTGGNYKNGTFGGEYSEMRGGLNYHWKNGSIGLIKDHVNWGTNYHGANIISDKAPSFAQITLQLKPVSWFEFNYLHGWLVSNMVDSSRTYFTPNGNQRDVMRPKYIAANMYTIQPVKDIYFSFGNSVIYSDMNPHPGYLIPFIFYKSVDHWLNSTDGVGRNIGQNAQMFLNLSVFKLKYFHLYGSLFIDELKVMRIVEPGKHNFWSFKAGLKHQTPLIPGLSVVTEYTRTRPHVYQHYIQTTNFESNGFNMGHYLRDNAEEWFVGLHYKPINRLHLHMEYTYARKGDEYGYDNGSIAITDPFLKDLKWTYQNLGIAVHYEILQNASVRLGYEYQHHEGEDVETYTPELYRGKTHGFIFGLRTGIQ